MQEVWKDVVGYEGLYQISSFGRIKTFERKKFKKTDDCFVMKKTGKSIIMKTSRNQGGYETICLHKCGEIKQFKIHRLVATAFIENPNNLPCVNHKDENKLNNCVDNLEWCKEAYNIHYGTRTEKASKPVYCVELNKTYKSMKEAGEEVGTKLCNISKVCRGQNKTCAGYHWRYAD